VVGIDFTVQQLEKARRIAEESGLAQVELREGRIEKLPVEGATCDCVISNGVINLAPEKEPVFAEAARVLKPGGRLAIADIVSEQQMKESIVCDADLWASCIGGAAQQDAYREAIEARACESRRSGITPTSSSPIAPATRARSTASRASRCWPSRARRRSDQTHA